MPPPSRRSSRNRPFAHEVQIEGLKDFVRDLERMQGKAVKNQFKEASKRVAEILIPRAQSRAAGVRRQAAVAAGTMRAAKQTKRAVIRMGSSAIPWVHGAEYGSIAHPQFLPWRGSSTGAGYFFWPTVRDSNEDILNAYMSELDKIADQAFPD